MALIIDNLEKTFGSLEKAIALLKERDEEDRDMFDALRDSVVRRFEYTYELAFKFIKRQLKAMSGNPQEYDEMSFRDVIRRAGTAGLVANVEAFFRYREARNLTSHTYDQDKSEQVLAVVPDFINDARSLIQKLKELNQTNDD